MKDEKRAEYTIPAGEFAQICGTTRDTLRYYEKLHWGPRDFPWGPT